MFKKFLRVLRVAAIGIYVFLFRKIVNTLFHIDWYHHAPKTAFLGVGTLQNPMDMWVKQEIIFDVKPDIIVECGTHRGGTALYYASLFSAMNHDGRVVTIEMDPTKLTLAATYPVFQKHCMPIVGDTTSDGVVKQVAELVRGKKTLVILDSWHEKNHVRKEMELYGGFVSPGSYMIVEDTNVNGHPVGFDYGPGPHEAVVDFMESHDEFIIDHTRERMMFTYFPDGYLKKKSP